MQRFLGGAQTPLIRGLFRAAAVKTKFLDSEVEFQFNDTDVCGMDSTISEFAQTTPWKEKREWLPIQWEYPFRVPSKQYLRIKGSEKLVIAGLDLQMPGLRDLLLQKTRDEIQWAVDFLLNGQPRMWLDASAIEQRAKDLLDYCDQLARDSISLGDFWIGLGLRMLGPLANGIRIVSFANNYWRLTDHEDSRLSLLKMFLEDRTLIEKYLKARGIESGDLSRLPFFLIYKRDGRILRDNLVTNATSIAELAAELEGKNPLGIVPKILPLMVQLRELGTTYLTDPGYLGSAKNFARLIEVPQNPILVVKFDVIKALDKRVWRAMLREYVSRAKPGDNNKWQTHAQLKPTLIFYWIMGGNELIEKICTTANLKFIN